MVALTDRHRMWVVHGVEIALFAVILLVVESLVVALVAVVLLHLVLVWADVHPHE